MFSSFTSDNIQIHVLCVVVEGRAAGHVLIYVEADVH